MCMHAHRVKVVCWIAGEGKHELRCVLLMALVVACGGSFLLEQPRSSVMIEFFRMQWFTKIVKATCLHQCVDQETGSFQLTLQNQEPCIQTGLGTIGHQHGITPNAN